MKSKEYIKKIILTGTPAQKMALYSFDNNDSPEVIRKKFKLFTRGNFIRYFQDEDAPFHDEMVDHYILSYLGGGKYLNIAYRNSAKTTLKKLFDVFVLLNDKRSSPRKFMKVLTRDIANARQIVTDVYNMIIEVIHIYGDPFENDSKKKIEESMSSFTLSNGRKYSCGTVGSKQRGQIQDAYRPDYIWFDDVEDGDSIQSLPVTEAIIRRIDEAIQGLAKGGTYAVTANYISEFGVIQWFKDKKDIITTITPIIDQEGKPLWPRHTLADVEKIKNDAEDWAGDYLCDPTQTDMKFFDLERINADLKKIQEPLKIEAGLKTWQEYEPHHRYALGADTAEGIGRDSNTLVVFDFTKGEQVASYANATIAPDIFGHEIARAGGIFGGCLVAPERNNTGFATLTTLKGIYTNIYKEKRREGALDKDTDRLGWVTNRKTKPEMFYRFKKDYNDGLIIINDKDILMEMKAYSMIDLEDSHASSLITRHFDLLTATVIAWQMNVFTTQRVEALKPHIPVWSGYGRR